MERLNLKLKKGRTKIFQIVLTNVSNPTDIKSKLYAVDSTGAEKLNIQASINQSPLTLIFTVSHAISSQLTPSKLNYEIIGYYENKNLVENLFEGTITVDNSLLTDPTL